MPPSPAPQDPPAPSFGALLQAAFRSEGQAALLDEAVQARLRDAVPRLPLHRVLLSVKHVLLYVRTAVERFRQVRLHTVSSRPHPSPASPSLQTGHGLLAPVAGSCWRAGALPTGGTEARPGPSWCVVTGWPAVSALSPTGPGALGRGGAGPLCIGPGRRPRPTGDRLRLGASPAGASLASRLVTGGLDPNAPPPPRPGRDGTAW